jgi:hypothetical protein
LFNHDSFKLEILINVLKRRNLRLSYSNKALVKSVSHRNQPKVKEAVDLVKDTLETNLSQVFKGNRLAKCFEYYSSRYYSDLSTSNLLAYYSLVE